jgi:hypothetical protein
VNTVTNLLMTFREVLQFLDDSLEISDGGRRSAIPDGIDPQHTIALSQALHDVFLAEWIAIPVVAEADDLLSFDHIRPLHLNGSGSARTEINTAPFEKRNVEALGPPQQALD